MKKYTILLALIFLGTVAAVSAQVKQISEDGFRNAEFATKAETENLTQRTVTKTEYMENDGTVFRSILRTMENIPYSTGNPSGTRVLTVDKSGTYEEIKEIILIGAKTYIRENGEWRIEESKIGNGPGDGLEYGSCRQYTSQNETVDGVEARKLSVFEIYNDSSKGFMYQNYSVWYDKEKKFLRKERIKGILDPRTVTFREVMTYEYNLTDLKIEAPIK